MKRLWIVTDRLPDGRERIHGDPDGMPLAEAEALAKAPGMWAVTLVAAELRA
jgi:hypothetical protein